MLIRLIRRSFVLPLLLACSFASALEAMDDEHMSAVSGTGLAIALSNFDMVAGPTSYFEGTGQTPAGSTVWQRGDGRYYGIAISGDSGGMTAWGGPCGSGINNMGCPIGGTVTYFAAFDNPFILRVYDYSTNQYGGLLYNYAGASTTQSVFEFLAPTNSDTFRWSTWTELLIGGTTTTRLQGNLTLSNNKLSDVMPNNVRGNNKIRIVSHTNPADPTVGFIWENFYQGNFRFSVNQLFSSPDAYGTPPWFTDNEGFYAYNIHAHVPMGQLFYQSLILDDTAAHDGNFAMIVTLIPNNSTVYGDFYSFSAADATYTGASLGYKRTSRPNHYYDTHGYFTVGTSGTTNNNGTTGNTGTRTTDTTDGIFFVKGDASPTFSAYADRPNIAPNADPGTNTLQYGGTTTTPGSIYYTNLSRVNLGDVNIQGILINHLAIQTCSSGSGAAC